MAEQKKLSLWDAVKANVTTPGGSGIAQSTMNKGGSASQGQAAAQQSRDKLKYGK